MTHARRHYGRKQREKIEKRHVIIRRASVQDDIAVRENISPSCFHFEATRRTVKYVLLTLRTLVHNILPYVHSTIYKMLE